ncbi:hypothetical protein [Desulfonatronum parangueonense]
MDYTKHLNPGLRRVTGEEILQHGTPLRHSGEGRNPGSTETTVVYSPVSLSSYMVFEHAEMIRFCSYSSQAGHSF